MSDNEIVDGIKSGNTKALERLVDKYSKYLAVVIAAIGKTHFTKQDIEEITADCFIAFWKSSSSFEMRSESLKSYLVTIVRNNVKNIFISRKIEYLPLEEDVLADDSNIENDYIKKEAELCVKNCVLELTELDRSIFILRYFYFFKIYEIAKKLSMNQKTVETRLIRGREKLKLKLRERGFSI